MEAGDYLHRGLGRFDTELHNYIAPDYDHRARSVQGYAVEYALYAALEYFFGIMGDWVEVWVCLNCKIEIDNFETQVDKEGSHISCLNTVEMTRRWLPWETGDTKLNRWTLLRTLVWYADEFGLGRVMPLQLPGEDVTEVEWEIELPFLSPDGDPYRLTGYFDGPVEAGSECFVRERKVTTSSVGGFYFNLFDPHIQTDTYDWASGELYGGKLDGVMLEVIQIGVGFSRVQRRILHKTAGQREEVGTEIAASILHAEKTAMIYGKNPWPMNKANCNLFAGTTEGSAGGCMFKEVCNKDPSQRERYLVAGFVKEERG